MPAWIRWPLGTTLAAAIVVVPFVHFRATYAHAKRFREVTPGRFYRSGQLTADGLEEVIRRYGIRTVVNLQNEAPDPLIPRSYYRGPRIRESELCESLGVRYVLLEPDLVDPACVPPDRPKVVDDFLRILDDPAAYPVLLHCKAGLHRTGLLTAIYRMEYDGWGLGAAVRELRANGFGDDAAHADNVYLVQYLMHYRPGIRRTAGEQGSGGAEANVTQVPGAESASSSRSPQLPSSPAPVLPCSRNEEARR
jgi:hypothetical protein